MTGYYIEAEPLTPEMAAEIDKLLSTLTISASSAGAFLSLTASLARISNKTDICVPATPSTDD